MPYVYVYAPVTGQNWGQATYCSNGQPHPVVSVLGGCCPIDISGSAGNSLYFYGSSVIQSIRTRRVSGVCRVDPAPWTDGVVMDFFAKPNGQCYIGSVGYGHVRNRVSDGVRNVRTLKIVSFPLTAPAVVRVACMCIYNSPGERSMYPASPAINGCMLVQHGFAVGIGMKAGVELETTR